MLGRHRHRAAVIGAIQQEGLDELGCARHEPGSQARQAGSLRQRMEGHAAGEARAAQRFGRTQQRRRRGRFVVEQVCVALVRGDHEVMPLGELQRALADSRDLITAPTGFAGTAQEQQLAALPHLGGNRVEVRQDNHWRRWCRGSAARRRPAAPRLRRSGSRDSASPPARRAGAARSTTACTKANSASRVPLTGSTCVSGIDAGGDSRSAARASARRPDASRQAARGRVTAELAEDARAACR